MHLCFLIPILLFVGCSLWWGLLFAHSRPGKSSHDRLDVCSFSNSRYGTTCGAAIGRLGPQGALPEYLEYLLSIICTDDVAFEYVTPKLRLDLR
jgi:hypothetical protein